MENNLISRTALKEELVRDLANTIRMTEMFKSDMAVRVLYKVDEAPTIEAEPVRHGRWGKAEIIGYDGSHDVYAAPCSVCGAYTKEYRPNFCPNCGAKMDGGAERSPTKT